MEDTRECGLHPADADELGWSWRLLGPGLLSDSLGL